MELSQSLVQFAIGKPNNTPILNALLFIPEIIPKKRFVKYWSIVWFQHGTKSVKYMDQSV